MHRRYIRTVLVVFILGIMSMLCSCTPQHYRVGLTLDQNGTVTVQSVVGISMEAMYNAGVPDEVVQKNVQDTDQIVYVGDVQCIVRTLEHSVTVQDGRKEEVPLQEQTLLYDGHDYHDAVIGVEGVTAQCERGLNGDTILTLTIDPQAMNLDEQSDKIPQLAVTVPRPYLVMKGEGLLRQDGDLLYLDLVNASHNQNEEVVILAMTRENPMVDVEPGKWYYEALNTALHSGILQGVMVTQNGVIMMPYDLVSLGQICKVITNILNVELEQSRPGEHWSIPSVRWCVEQGVLEVDCEVSELDKSLLDSPVTREMALSVLSQALYDEDRLDDEQSQSEFDLSHFKDLDTVTDRYRDNVITALVHGMAMGTDAGMLLPLENLNRAELAQMLLNVGIL